MSCRFPEAPDIQTFWRNCLEKRVSFSELRDQRWDHEQLYDHDVRAKNRTHTRTAALLHDIDLFNARHFEVSPRRAKVMDPQQRLMLELGKEALQDAGLEQREYGKERSAVFLGASVSEFAGILAMKLRSQQLGESLGEGRLSRSLSELPDTNAYFMTGSLVNMTAATVAQTFKFQGPAATVDTACSSALTAVIQGVEYLRALPSDLDRSPVVLAGAVYLMLHPDNAVCFAKVGALAESECRPFDAEAGGFILGEGAGMFVLKRLDDALRDRDRVYAVIEGTAWNNDGGSSTPMTPSVEGQARLLRQGFENSELSPEDVGYLECHGTATYAGDKTELTALSEVFPATHRPCLGSVKANIGHTLSAAGAAGLLRAVLALHHRVLPPQAGWKKWHPDLAEQAERFEIPLEPVSWEEPKGASVSAFGFGGTNCMVLLKPASVAKPPSGSEPHLLGFFAPSLELLESYLRSCEPVLADEPPAAVSRALAARSRDRFAAFCLATDGREALGGARELRRLLLEGVEQLEGRVLVGRSEEIAGLRDGPWKEAAAWCRGTVSEKNHPSAASLPPSPLERKSFWPHSFLPGPRSEATPPPPPEAEEPGVHRLGLESHPFLTDHCLKGRPFLPLASALDYMIEDAGLKPPFALENLRVARGVLIPKGRTARVKVARVGDRVELRELRKSGREVEAFGATVAASPNGTPPHVPSPSEPATMKVDDFYRGHTFHGPSLQGILCVRGLDEQGLEAEVATSRPCQWTLTDARERWSLDPLVVDSAFQLAIYWSRALGNPGLLPHSIEQVKVWSSLPQERVEVRIRKVSQDAEGLMGDFLLLDQGTVRVALLGVRAKFYEY